MPIYEFECTKCGHSQEVWMKFSDKPLTHCESCNGKMKKLISPSTFHLKGTGWYVTDYASKSRNTQENTKSTEKTESKSEAKTSEKSSDSKKATSASNKNNE
jgi:putative FmdB family regulatory protein